MGIEQGKGSLMSLICGKYVAALAAGTANDAWVQSFGYEPQYKTETYNAFGFVDPVIVEDSYNGVKGSFDVLPNASNIIESCLTNQDVATAIMFDPSGYGSFYIAVNVKDPKTGVYFRSHLVKKCKVVGNPYSATVDGKSTLKFDFEGTGVVKAKLPVQITETAGTNSASQVITLLGSTGYKAAMTQAGGNYAQLVLVDGVALAKTTEYTETATAVTIINAVPVTSKIQIISYYTPA